MPDTYPLNIPRCITCNPWGQLRYLRSSVQPCYKGSLPSVWEGGTGIAHASHQCGPGSIPGVDVICGLSLLLVLVPAPRGFL